MKSALAWLARHWAHGLVLLSAVVLLVLLARASCRPAAIPVSPAPDTLPDPEITDDRPDVDPPGVVERIVKVYVPVRREVSAGTPDSALAQRYADLAREYRRWRIRREQDSLAALRGDTTHRADSSPAPPSILPPVTVKYDGRRAVLHLTESSGRVMRATARVRPRFSIVAGQGGVSDTLPLVKADRWFVREAREALSCAPVTVLAILTGALVAKRAARGALIGAAIGAVACQANPS